MTVAWRMFAGMALGCAAACSAADDGSGGGADSTILSMSGRMDAQMLAALRRQDWRAVRAVEFSSEGGWPDVGLAIAKLLARTGRPIIVHDICASACLDVLVIKDRVTIRPDTIVLLHNTPMGQALTTGDYPRLSLFLASMGREEQAWLQANGVDPRLTLLSEAAIGPVCVFAARDDAADAASFVTLTRFDVWAPRSATLVRLGLRSATHWRQDTAAVIGIMRARYPHANLARLRAADEPDVLPSDSDLSMALRAVRACPSRPGGSVLPRLSPALPQPLSRPGEKTSFAAPYLWPSASGRSGAPGTR